MRRAVEQSPIGPKRVCVPLAVMNVEIDRPQRARPCSTSGPRALSAPTATLLNRQNPIGRPGSAWWPGGRTAQKALSASPATTASTAAATAPAACSAASPDSGQRITVSASIADVAGFRHRSQQSVRPGGRGCTLGQDRRAPPQAPRGVVGPRIPASTRRRAPLSAAPASRDGIGRGRARGKTDGCKAASS